MIFIIHYYLNNNDILIIMNNKYLIKNLIKIIYNYFYKNG